MAKRLKYTLLIVFILLLALVVWTYSAIIIDDSPNPEALDMLYEKREAVLLEDNALYAFVGLTAPSNIKDIHAYGVKRVGATIAQLKENRKNTHGNNIRDIEGEIDFVGNYKKLLCWLNIPDDSGSGCAQANEVNQMWRDNQLLVQRYFTLGDYSQWRGVMGLNRNLPKSILINYLVLVKVSVLLEQEQYSEAYSLWLKNITVWSSLVRKPMPFVSAAVMRVNYDFSLIHFNDIVRNRPDEGFDFASVHNVLDIPGLSDFDVDAMLREEYALWEMNTCVGEEFGYKGIYPCACKASFDRPHVVPNAFFKRVRQEKQWFAYSHQALIKNCKQTSIKDRYLKSKPVALLKALNYFFMYKEETALVFLGGGLKGCELSNKFRKQSAETALLRLYLDILEAKIPAESIEQYIQSKKSILEAQFLGALPLWNATNKELSLFTDRDDLSALIIKVYE